MDQKIIGLYDDYTNNLLDRRHFLKKLTKLAGGTAAAVAMLPLLEKRAPAQIVAKDDSRLETQYVQYPGETGKVTAYWARPKGGNQMPGVVVIHENRGLRPHIKDVTRRLAVEGFIALAPDALSPLGGTPQDADKGRTLMRKLDRESTQKNFIAAVKYLKSHPQINGKIGVTGFCWGGAMTNHLAVHCPELSAAVPFYGRQPKAEDVPKIKASLLCHYGGTDKRINAGIPEFEKALKAAGVEYQMFTYEGAGHAFFNDTGTRYHEKAATLAWERTIHFFKKKLKS